MDAALSAPRHAAPIVFEDGLGERLPAVGGANESLEVLKVSNELSAVSTFETALREQSLRLSEFRHDAFARVRAVERLDPRTSTVVVISDRVRGVRLSEVLATAERQGIALELNAALCLIRQLVAAVAAFHEAAPDSCHGAIAPDRIVITQEGRLVVVEYVLGPALEELRFSQERYWRELGIALPHTFGLPRFDLFADVTQVGAVALALVLGRRLHVDEFPTKIGEVVDNASTRLESGESEPIPVLLRTWLRSALQLEPRHSFVSAIGAKKDLDVALSHASPEAERASLRAFLTKYTSAVLADRTPEAAAATIGAPVERPAPVQPPPVVIPIPVSVAPPVVPVAPPPAAPKAAPVASVAAATSPVAPVAPATPSFVMPVIPAATPSPAPAVAAFSPPSASQPPAAAPVKGSWKFPLTTGGAADSKKAGAKKNDQKVQEGSMRPISAQPLGRRRRRRGGAHRRHAGFHTHTALRVVGGRGRQRHADGGHDTRGRHGVRGRRESWHDAGQAQPRRR